MAAFKSHGGIVANRQCLPHGMDYLIVGAADSVGIQRKSGAMEIPKQMSALRDDILPALKELTENPVLLIEEDFVIGSNGVFYRREEGMLKPTDLNTKSYFNFIHSVKASGVDVITTRNLDASIWWMIATGLWVETAHYPKLKKQFTPTMQALGAICCANGVGPSKSEQLLKVHSLRELATMPDIELAKLMSINQLNSFKRMLDARM